MWSTLRVRYGEVTRVPGEGDGDGPHGGAEPMAAAPGAQRCVWGHFLAAWLALHSPALIIPEDDLFPFILPAGSTNAKLSARRYFSK